MIHTRKQKKPKKQIIALPQGYSYERKSKYYGRCRMCDRGIAKNELIRFYPAKKIVLHVSCYNNLEKQSAKDVL